MSYLNNVSKCTNVDDVQTAMIDTYPNRIPPKATKSPIAMAGTAEPAVPGGFLTAMPIVRDA